MWSDKWGLFRMERQYETVNNKRLSQTYDKQPEIEEAYKATRDASQESRNLHENETVR